jgi:AraC-like DNA-binding protein
VAEATGWEKRFAELDRALSRRVIRGAEHRHGSIAPELEQAWTLLHDSGGAITVNELAAATGWSRRHLTAKFRDEFGLPPKVVGRIIRFDRARHSLPQRRGDLATVAAECGYADQAHMIREFHDFCGCAPTEWLAEEFADDPSLSQLVTA